MRSNIRCIPKFWGIHAEPRGLFGWVLSALPFVVLIGVYWYFSYQRHVENPVDKALPSLKQMVDALSNLALVPDQRTGEYSFLVDTTTSLKRLGWGLSVPAVLGLVLGINLGLFPGLRKVLLNFFTFFSSFSPMAVMPIILIVFGVDEFSKFMLLVIGLTPGIFKGIYLEVINIPIEQKTKALTLGASQLGMVYRVILPRVLPNLFELVAGSLGIAWIFLISAEAISSNAGLGCRIFQARRYMNMDVIIPYAAWIALLGFIIFQVLMAISRWTCSWYTATK